MFFFFFSSRRRHTRCLSDWSSDVCSSDLDVRVLALGNPTIASGPFHDTFTSNRDGWGTFTISAFDSPNLTGLSLDDLLSLPDRARPLPPPLPRDAPLGAGEVRRVGAGAPALGSARPRPVPDPGRGCVVPARRARGGRTPSRRRRWRAPRQCDVPDSARPRSSRGLVVARPSADVEGGRAVWPLREGEPGRRPVLSRLRRGARPHLHPMRRHPARAGAL